MSDHISTEEAERIARAMEDCCPCGCGNELMVNFAAPALRSLAAENERLTNENTMLRNEVADLKSEVDQARESCWAENEKLRGRGIGKIADEAFAQGFKRGYAAGSGENQP